VGGVREAVVDGVNGFIVPAQDAIALRLALELLAGNPDLRQRMGRASRELFLRQFTLERMLSKTVSVYRQFVKAEADLPANAAASVDR
jgi:glycosyltransferase involved in cell wall biosynthesis